MMQKKIFFYLQINFYVHSDDNPSLQKFINLMSSKHNFKNFLWQWTCIIKQNDKYLLFKVLSNFSYIISFICPYFL